MPTVAAQWLRGYTIPAGVIIGWHGTNASTPQGWPRETTLDSTFPKQIATSATNPGAVGGTATHAHPFSAHSSHTYNGHNHAGSWGTSPSGGGNIQRASGALTYDINHTHPSSSTAAPNITVSANASPANTDAAASDPLHVTTIFLRSNGAPMGIPVGGIVWFNGALPAGFGAVAALNDRLMKGAAAGADGGTSGGTDPSAHTHTTAAHDHAVAAHTHVVALDVIAPTTVANGPQFGADAPNHGHTLGTSTSTGAQTSSTATETTGAGNGLPPWIKMRAVTKTTNPGTVAGIIAMWAGTLASIPAGWRLCDGTGGTPNLSQGRFTMGLGTGAVGDVGGAATHTHAAGSAHTHGSSGTHQHTFTGASSTDPATGSLASGTFQFFNQGHSHGSATYTAPAAGIGTSTGQATAQNANTSNDPPFRGVAYIQLTIGM